MQQWWYQMGLSGIIFNKSLGTVGSLLLQLRIFTSTEIKMKTIGEYAHAQSATSESFTVIMMQKIKMRVIGKTTEMVRGSI